MAVELPTTTEESPHTQTIGAERKVFAGSGVVSKDCTEGVGLSTVEVAQAVLEVNPRDFPVLSDPRLTCLDAPKEFIIGLRSADTFWHLRNLLSQYQSHFTHIDVCGLILELKKLETKVNLNPYFFAKKYDGEENVYQVLFGSGVLPEQATQINIAHFIWRRARLKGYRLLQYTNPELFPSEGPVRWNFTRRTVQ